jgi:F0F1-type ATP synthase assembly protein I
MDRSERRDARIETRLREWAAERERPKARADAAAAEARRAYYERVDLRADLDSAITKLREPS